MNEIYLACRSKKGDADWYGDFNYCDNSLKKYIPCNKQCETTILRGSGHGYGIPGVKVKTTKEFIKMMGWEDDLKYEIAKEQYNNIV